MDRFEGYKGVVRDNSANSQQRRQPPGNGLAAVRETKLADMKNPSAPETETQHSSEKSVKGKPSEIELKVQ